MFLLLPAHPGCPGQIPQSRKMVVCVCVYILALESQCKRGNAYSIMNAVVDEERMRRLGHGLGLVLHVPFSALTLMDRKLFLLEQMKHKNLC